MSIDTTPLPVLEADAFLLEKALGVYREEIRKHYAALGKKLQYIERNLAALRTLTQPALPDPEIGDPAAAPAWRIVNPRADGSDGIRSGIHIEYTVTGGARNHGAPESTASTATTDVPTARTSVKITATDIAAVLREARRALRLRDLVQRVAEQKGCAASAVYQQVRWQLGRGKESWHFTRNTRGWTLHSRTRKQTR